MRNVPESMDYHAVGFVREESNDFFLFHPKNYYKLSLRVTFSDAFDNL